MAPLRSDNKSGLCATCYRRAYQLANQLHLNEKQRMYREGDIPRYLLQTARKRAKANGVEFDLTVDQIHVPTHCPLLGVELHMGSRENHEHAPSLDRIDNALGYTPSNIQVLSMAANRAKSNLSEEQLRVFCTAYLASQGLQVCSVPRFMLASQWEIA